MIILCTVAGIFVGSLVNWAGDFLPRWASGKRAFPPPTTQPVLALWHLLASFISGKGVVTCSWLAVAVELVIALLFAYLWERFGLSWRLFSLAVTCSFFVLIAVIDLKHRLVLNVLVYPAAVIALLLHSLPPGKETLSALSGGLFGLAPFLLAALLRPAEIGGGDVKLAALTGLIVGFPLVVWALLVGVLAGGVAVLVLLLTRRWELKSYIPYAPFICFGAVLSLVCAPFLLMGPR